MKRVMSVYVLAFVVMFGVGAAIAQETKAPAAKSDPVLTEAQTDKFDKMALLLERTGKAASPDELGREIAQLITERQKAAQQAASDLNAYYQTLAVEGWTLNPQTKKYEKKPDKK